MKRYTVILMLVLFCAVMLYAQTPLERMNSIKASDEFYWDEYTHPSADTATIGAVQRVLLYIKVPEGKSLTESDIMPSVKFIKMKRTTLTRVFAYIKKKDAEGIVNSDNSNSKTEVSPVVADKKDTEHIIPLLSIVKELLGKTDFYEAYQYLESQSENGNITGYGPLKDVENIDNSYLAIFDKQTQSTICVLSPSLSDKSRTNLVSGVRDSLAQYEDGKHIAIWFSIKQ